MSDISEFEIIERKIDESDDFDFLTNELISYLAAVKFKPIQIKVLLSKISLKACVPVSALMFAYDSRKTPIDTISTPNENKSPGIDPYSCEENTKIEISINGKRTCTTGELNAITVAIDCGCLEIEIIHEDLDIDSGNYPGRTPPSARIESLPIDVAIRLRDFLNYALRDYSND